MRAAWRGTAAKLAGIAVLVSAPFAAGALSRGIFAAGLALAMAFAVAALVRRSQFAAHATLVVVSLALGIAVFDLALRALGFGPPAIIGPWPAMPLVNRFAANLDIELLDQDLARMSGRPAPAVPTHHIVTDGAGFRNAPSAPRDGLDVIVLGDSFGAGAVGHDETLRAFLQREHGMKALDLSTPASSPWQEYTNFRLELPTIGTRKGAVLAWLLFGGNDLEETYGPLEPEALPWTGPRQWLQRWRSWRARSPILNLTGRPGPSSDVATHSLDGKPILFYRPYIANARRDLATVTAQPNFPALRATFSRLVALARSRDIVPVVFVIPAKEEVYEWVHRGSAPWSSSTAPSGFAQAIARMCDEEKVACQDLKPALVEESRRSHESSGELLYWREDTHLNARGNRFIASRMRQFFGPR